MSEASLINIVLEKSSEIHGNSSWKGICIRLENDPLRDHLNFSSHCIENKVEN